MLEIHCEDIPRDLLDVPLKSTKEIDQLCNLLFSYSKLRKKTYSVDLIFELLINKILLVNYLKLSENNIFFKLLNLMYEHRYENFKIQDFCKLLHVSESTLTRGCKKSFNSSPTHLFKKIKCAEAKKLLRETSLTIEEIGRRLGFRSIQHFSSVFKRVTGITPTKYRKEIHKISEKLLEGDVRFDLHLNEMELSD